MQVTCKIGYKHPEEATLTCLEGTDFSATHEIKCSTPGSILCNSNLKSNTKLNKSDSSVI